MMSSPVSGNTSPAIPSDTKAPDKAPPSPLYTRAPMTAREAQLSSVFDACIPGSMLMYPVINPPSTSVSSASSSH